MSWAAYSKVNTRRWKFLPKSPFPLSLLSFFFFIRRFWNQILICLSESFRESAISMRFALVMYWLNWNSFSSSMSWALVYAVRALLFPITPCFSRFDFSAAAGFVSHFGVTIKGMKKWNHFSLGNEKIQRYIIFQKGLRSEKSV